MQTFDPHAIAIRALKHARRGVAPDFEDGPVGDIQRDALVTGLPALLAARRGWVYLAANASWPGLHKVGCTRRGVAQRMAALSGAGVATPWVCVASWQVHDAAWLEAKAHEALQACWVRSELFEAPAERICELVEHCIAQENQRLLRNLREFIPAAELEPPFAVDRAGLALAYTPE